jgi:hypothetical protein
VGKGAGVKVNLVTTPLEYGTAQVVMQNHPRCAEPGFKGMHMAAQEIFQSLIEEKFQIQSTGVGQSDDETGEAPAGTTHTNFPEMSPIHLCFFRREFMQLQKGFSADGTQGGHHTAHLDHTALVAADADLRSAG